MATDQDIFINIDWERGERIRVTRTPVQGPRPPSWWWLLGQSRWWYPYRRPAVLVPEMDKPHRYNTVKWLERRAAALAMSAEDEEVRWAAVLDMDIPDGLWERRDPVLWLHRQPLVKALKSGLPTKPDKIAALAERARHWSTCPLRLRPEMRNARDRCQCPPRPPFEAASEWARAE